MSLRCSALLTAWVALAACRQEPAPVVAPESLTVGPETIAVLEARIQSDGDAALDELVQLVVASPLDLPGGELDRLGRLLIERSDRERLLERLRERALARPENGKLEGWLERLDAYERSIQRGVDVYED